jgi:integrase
VGAERAALWVAISSNVKFFEAAYRVREHLTEDEMARLLAALRRNRHGLRDWLIGLLIYRHGLRVRGILPKRTIIVRRL